MRAHPTAPFLHWQANGDCLIDIHWVPNAARTHSEEVFDGALKVRLHARPIEGQANTALLPSVQAKTDATKPEGI